METARVRMRFEEVQLNCTLSVAKVLLPVDGGDWGKSGGGAGGGLHLYYIEVKYECVCVQRNRSVQFNYYVKAAHVRGDARGPS